MGPNQHYCVFCCREIFPAGLHKEHSNEAKFNMSLVHQFFKFFSRYCFKSNNKFDSNQHNVCDNCTVVLKDFNELFHKMDCIRLKLNWRIETLKNIMEQANKAPSRHHAFGPPGKENGGKHDNEEIRKFRTQFGNDCTSHSKACWPIIKLSLEKLPIINRELTISNNLERNQDNQQAQLPVYEANQQNGELSGNDDSQIETTEINSIPFGLLTQQKENSVLPDNTDLNNIGQDGLSVDKNQQTSSNTQTSTEHIIKRDNTISEITTSENVIASIFVSTTEINNTTCNEIADLGSISNTTQSEQINEDIIHHQNHNLVNSPTVESAFDENNAVIVNFVSGFGPESTELEIDVMEQIDPICELGEQAVTQDFNDRKFNELEVSDPSTAFNEELVQNDILPVEPKRSLRKILQCKLCKLTFSTSARLEYHLKSHDNRSDDSQPENNPAGNSSSSEGASDSDSNSIAGTKLTNYVQCSKCTKYFGKGYDIKHHMKNAHYESFEETNIQSAVNDGVNKNETNNVTDDDELSNVSKRSNKDLDSSYFGSSSSSSENDDNCESDVSTKPDVKHLIPNKNVESSIKNSENTEPPTKKIRRVPWTKFKCKFCKRTFARKRHLEFHKRQQHREHPRKSSGSKNTTRFQCQHCQKYFHSQQKTYVHIWQHHSIHNTSPFMEDLIVKDNFTINDVIHKTNAKYPCEKPNCTQKFLTEDTFNDHSKLHDNFTCEFCPEKFTFAPELALHEVKNHSKSTNDKTSKPYMCTRCPYSCQEQDKYVNHFLLSHFNLLMDLCRCLVCKAPFYSSDNNLEYMLGHHLAHHEMSNANSSEIYRCEDCSAYFITVIQLSRHKIMFHASGDKKHTCADCGKKFRLTCQLKQHRDRVHNAIFGEHQYSCNVDGCEIKFETKLELDSHTMHRHSGNDPILMCTDCGKRFGGKSALHKHRQVHDADFQEKMRKEKELGFVCEQCGKKFMVKHRLEKHYKSHSGPESWEFCCEICSKKCLTNGKLMEHMRVHTQEKPYVCDVCGQKYAHRHNWRLHLKSKHGQT